MKLRARSSLIVLACFAMVMAMAAPALAHYVYKRYCDWDLTHTRVHETRVEISHGTGGGYSKAELNVRFACGGASDYWGWHQKVRIRAELYKKTGVNVWTKCAQTGFVLTNQDYAKVTRYWGGYPLCGTGTYATTMRIEQVIGGAWTFVRNRSTIPEGHFLPA